MQQRLKDQHLPKDGGRFSGRQRSVGLQSALLAGQVLVDAMAQLMSQRLHVAHLAVIIHKYVGMYRRNGTGRIGATALAGLHSSRSEEHTSELQSRFDLVCRLLLEK